MTQVNNTILRHLTIRSAIIILVILLIDYFIEKTQVVFFQLSPVNLLIYRFAVFIIALSILFYFMVFMPMKKQIIELNKNGERFYSSASKNERHYRELLYDLNEAFCLIDLVFDDSGNAVDFRFLEVNPAYEKLTGDINSVGKLRSEIFRDAEPEGLKIYDRIVKTGIPEHFESKAKSLDCYFDVHAYKINSSKVAIFFNDITQRKKTEEELRKSEVRHRRFFESSLFGAVYWGLDGRIMDANDKFVEITGYSREEFANGSVGWTTFTAEEFKPIVEDKVRELLERGKITEPYESDIFRKDGQRITLQISAAVLDETKQEGIAFALDITERKKWEKELRQSEERFSKAFFQSPYATSIVRLSDNKNIEVNSTFLELFEFERAEVINHTSLELNIFKNFEQRANILALLEKERSVQNLELEMLTKTGKTLNVLVSLVKMVLMGEDHVYVNYIDVTASKKADEELKQSEERFSKAFFQSPFAASILRVSDEKYIEVNSTFLQLFELRRDEVIGHTPAELGLYQDLDQRAEILNSLKIQESVLNEEIQMKSSGGRMIYALVSFRKIKMSGIDHFFINYVDVTEQKKTQKELLQSEERFSRAFFNSPSAAALTKQSDKKCVEINSNFLQMFGFSREEAIGRTTEELKIYKSSEERDEVIALTDQQGYIHDREMEMQTHSGKILNVLYSSQIIFMNGENHYYINFIDITDRKRAELALKRSEQLWVTTLSSINEAVIATDAEGLITFINPEAECLMGWTRSEVLNHPVYEFYQTVNELSREKTDDPVQKILKHGVRYREKNHILLIRKDGKEVPIEQSGAPIIDGDNNVNGIVMIFHDITEHKLHEDQLKEYSSTLEAKVKERTSELALAKEQAESADRMKTSFLLTMSHELRTPLNSIIGFSGILNKELAGPLNEEQKKQTFMIQQSGRHLLHLVNDILDMSKIEVGELQVNFEIFDVGKSIEQVIEIEKILAEDKGLTLELNGPEEPITAESDPSRFQQVILNLIHNAVKFTDRGNVTVDYWVENATVYVRVSDTGIGIKEENISRLFVSFSRVQDHDFLKSHEGTGSGLGLAISKKIMEMLHGSIEVKSVYGKGSVFTVSLPKKAMR